MILKNESDLPLLDRKIGVVYTVEENLSGGDALEARDHAHERRFP